MTFETGLPDRCSRRRFGLLRMRVWLALGLWVAAALPAADATINLDVASRNFSPGVGATDPAAQSVQLTNTGPGGTTLIWTATSNRPWLTVSPASGSTTAGTEILTVNALLNPTEQWTRTTATTGAPTARTGHTAVWTGTEMIVWGGWDGSSTRYNTGASYNPATHVWKNIATSNAPTARYDHVAVWSGSKMIVWGGDDGSFTNTGGIYNPATDTWSNTAPTTTGAPGARMGAMAVWTGTRMLVWGGWDGSVQGNGGSYDPVGDSWTAMSGGLNQQNKRNATAVWTGSRMVIWGGATGGGLLNSGGIYDPLQDTWPETTSYQSVPGERERAVAVWTGTRMIVWGGYESAAINTGGVFNPLSDTWGTPPTTTGAPAARRGASAVWTGDEMIVWGGDDAAGSCFNDGKFYQPGGRLAPGVHTGNLTVADPNATNSPQTVTVTFTVPPPTILTDLTSLDFYAVPAGADPTGQTVNLTNAGASGSQLNWLATSDRPWLTVTPTAGTTTTGTSPLSIGAILNPAEAWSGAPSQTDAAPARYSHTAVWTGTEMIIWGGCDGGPLNSGARYSPATNTWKPMTTVNAPSARLGACAVWTGNVMVVWGGQDNSTRFGDGGRYDPATDTWLTTPLATTNAPSARTGASAIWTGTEMIVWGGAELSGTWTFYNTGGRYNPATNTWSVTPLSTTDAPAGRRFHAAVWTGSKMLVWGGDQDQGNPLNSGGSYDPATDTWSPTPISTTNSPGALTQQAAAWTGTEMIVWGGWDGWNPPALVNTGARYNPATDTWTTMTTTNAPSVRAAATGVWTGGRMIVWGGLDSFKNRNDGQFYQPGGALGAGIYTGHIAISDPQATNDPHQVTVTFTVAPTDLGLSTTTLSYNTAQDDTPTFVLSNTGGGTLNWTISSDQSWLVPTASGSNTGGQATTLLPMFTFGRMAPGNYSANLTVTAAGAASSPQIITVSLTVAAVDSFLTGATYLRDIYVAPSGNDSTGDGTLGAPYRSPEKALGVALAGDYIHVAAGSYSAWAGLYTPAPKGTYANPIRIAGDPAGGTVIDCAGGANGLYSTALRFTLVENFEIKDFTQHGISFDGNWNGEGRGHHVVIRNCKILAPQATALDGIKLFNVDTSVVEKCDIAMPGAAAASDAIRLATCYHDILRANNLHNLQFRGIRPSNASQDNTVYGNTINGAPEKALSLNGFRNNAIANVLIDCFNPLTFESAEEPLAANNTIYGARQYVLWFTTAGGDPFTTKNGSVVNNIFLFYNAQLTNYANNGGTALPATFTYKNNLWYSLDTPGFVGPTNVAAAEINPLYQVNPAFVYAPGYDFHLTAASSARAAGLATVGVTHDFDGAPYDNPPAMGAFQNALPVIDSEAAAAPNPVTTGFTTTVSVYASDADAYPSALTYTWSKVTGPGTVNFLPNGTTGAYSATASFSFQGVYTLKVDVSDGAATVSSTVDVTVTTQILIFVDSVNLTLVGPKKDLQGVATIHNGGGAPVAGLSITCNLFKDGVYWASRSGTTAGDGTFTFVQTNAAAGTLTARVSALSGTGYSWNGVSPVGSVVKTAVPAIAQSVALQLVGTNQDLKGTATIQDGSGNPLSGLAITCNVFQNGAYWVSRSGVTAADGTFTFTQLGAPSATLTARVSALSGVGFSWNGISPWGTVEKTAIAASVQSIGMQLVGANEDLQVTPTIWDPSNNPMAGLTVTCNIFNNGVYLSSRSGVTNASGQVVLTHPAPAPGTLTARVTAITGTNITWNRSTPIGSIVKTGNIAVVQSIGMALVGGNQDLQATPTIWDGSNNPVAGLTVTCNLFHNGVYLSSRTGVTNASGQVALIHPNPASGTLTARVIAISGAGYTWNGVTPVGSIVK